MLYRAVLAVKYLVVDNPDPEEARRDAVSRVCDYWTRPCDLRVNLLKPLPNDSTGPAVSFDEIQIEPHVVGFDPDEPEYSAFDVSFAFVVDASTPEEAEKIAVRIPFQLQMREEIANLCERHGLSGASLWSRNPGLVAIVDDGHAVSSGELLSSMLDAGLPVSDVYPAEWEPMPWEITPGHPFANERVFVFAIDHSFDRRPLRPSRSPPDQTPEP